MNRKIEFNRYMNWKIWMHAWWNFVLILLISCQEYKKAEDQSIFDHQQNLPLPTDQEETSMPAQGPQNYWYSNTYEGRELQRKGIRNPEAYIDSSLRSDPGLIPIEGTLGGTMHFGRVQLLSDQWLIADYDDGHVRGLAIYRFEVDSNKRVQFEIIRSMVDD